MKEYRIAKGWAIFIYISAPTLIGVFGWLLIMPFVPGMNSDPDALWILAPISLAMIGVAVVGLMDTIKGKFVIASDKIYTISTFSNRQLLFNEIKGYRVSDKYIFIESNIKEKKNIKISTYFGKTDEIIQWLTSNYPDLDVQNAVQEKEEILNNQDFGWSKEEREEKLNTARKTAKTLNWAGGLVAVWTLFVADPYEYAIIASIAIPIISIIAFKLSAGLIRIDETKGSAYPTIFWALFSSSIGICLRALFDYNIFTHTNIWAPAILITLVFTGILLIGNKEFKFKQAKDFFAVLGISFFLFGYSYGSVVTLNCYYDASESEVYISKILSKRVSSGKSTTYYFELTPWGPQEEADDVSVSEELYDRMDVDEDVTIYFKKGYFDIPWFIVTE